MYKDLVPSVVDNNNTLDVFLTQTDWTPPSVASHTLLPSYSNTGPANIQLTFSEPMTKSDGTSTYALIKNAGAESLTNYYLVSAGPDDTLDTLECQSLANDDVLISIDTAAYTYNTWTSDIGINGGTPLPLGKYRFFACGKNPYPPYALHDGVGNKMAASFIYDFVVTTATATPTSTFTPTATLALTPTPTAQPESYLTPTPAGELPPVSLPVTGFKPMAGSESLRWNPDNNILSRSDLWLKIEKLGLQTTIQGVPLTEGEWDVSWLGNTVGYLVGTSFPTQRGNSVLTAHAINDHGKAGPFHSLSNLSWGDKIEIGAFGNVYTYEVRTVGKISPTDLRALKTKKGTWITLLTCTSYNPKTEEYTQRLQVEAVLVEVR